MFKLEQRRLQKDLLLLSNIGSAMGTCIANNTFFEPLFGEQVLC